MRYIFVWLIEIYRKLISPIKPQATCRFRPTCSAYAIGAYKRFGVIRGTALTLWRLIRCNPWNEGGYDPVPEKFTFKTKRRSDTEEKT